MLALIRESPYLKVVRFVFFNHGDLLFWVMSMHWEPGWAFSKV